MENMSIPPGDRSPSPTETKRQKMATSPTNTKNSAICQLTKEHGRHPLLPTQPQICDQQASLPMRSLAHIRLQVPSGQHVPRSRYQFPNLQAGYARYRAKSELVCRLVNSATQIVALLWPSSVQPSECEIALCTFIQETLYRSRASYSSLTVALYYLLLLKPHLSNHKKATQLRCGRRMFLAALVLASKYLNDCNYSTGAWSRICGLPVREINRNVMNFVIIIDWKLHIVDSTWNRWQEVIHGTEPSSLGARIQDDWESIVSS